MLPYNVRDFDGMDPSLGHPDGKDAARDLTAHLNDVRGTAIIPAAASTVDVDVDKDLHDRPLLATLNGVDATGAADATATSLTSVRWDAVQLGRFSLNVNAAATLDVRVSYIVAGKSVG